MAGWTLVPESPQTAPERPTTQAEGWTPIEQPSSQDGAVAPSSGAISDLLDMGKLLPALIFSHMTGADPKLAYDQHDYIKQRLSATGSDFASNIRKDLTVEDDPLSLAIHKKLPEPFESHDMLDNFIHDMAEFAKDPVLYGPAVLGALAQSFGLPQGARIGTDVGFTVDAGLRKAYMDRLQKGTVVNFSDLASRTGSALWESAKGLLTGEAMHYAGGLPVPSVLGPLGGSALSGFYQASAMTIAGAILNGQMPTLESFERNAVLVGGLGVITHAVSSLPSVKQGMIDVYAKDGTTPEQTATKVAAQPPVKNIPENGLRPAIRVTAKDGSEAVMVGEPGEVHEDVARSALGETPVTLEELESNKTFEAPPPAEGMTRLYHGSAEPGRYEGPAFFSTSKEYAQNYRKGGELQYVDIPTKQWEELSGRDIEAGVTGASSLELDSSVTGPRSPLTQSAIDKVLNQPEIQVQQVIDKAYEMKTASSQLLLESGTPPEDIPPKALVKSGRGFTTQSGDFLSRTQAKKWVRDNEPEVFAMWEGISGGEFHAADYEEAQNRVAQRTVLEGDETLTGVSAELQGFLAKNREELNNIKAGNKSEGYGKSVIRTLFTGTRNMVRAYGEQVASSVAKLVPDSIDQEALTFYRDYRDDPYALQKDIEEIRAGSNEKLKQAIPSMERALKILDPVEYSKYRIEGEREPTENFDNFKKADDLLTNYFSQTGDLRTNFMKLDSSIFANRYSPRLFTRLIEDEEERAELGVGQAADTSGKGVGKFSKRSPNDIRREYLRILEPLKSGEVEARTFNAVDELRVYGNRLGTTVARSVFEMELKNSELGKEGVRVEKDPETGEKTENYPRNWVSLTGERKGLHVPPKIAEAMKPVLENDVISGAKYWKVAKLAQAYIKSIELGLSPFHMRALTISFMNNAGIDAYRKALATDNNSPEFEAQERKGALYGLETTKTGTPYEAYQGLKPSSVEDRSTLLDTVRKGYEPIDKIFKGVTKATFEVVQRKFKVIDFSAKEAQWLAKHPNATDAEYGTAMRSIAKEVNAVYGGLNWEVMGVSANFQAIARMFLLAPDWTFSNVANLKYAGEGGAGGKAARAFWLKSFATGYAMTQGMSLFLTGQMSKQAFSVYMGKDDKGKEMYSSIFLAGAPKDAVGLMNKVAKDGFPAGAVEFSINKASPLFGTGARMLLNKDWQGKPIYKPKEDVLTKSGKELAFGAEQLFPSPFVVKDIVERYMNPDESLSYKDFLAALAGASVYHEGPKKDSSKRKGYHLSGAR